MIVNGIVLAAGLSSRMNDFKPLMHLGDKTMIETVVDHMLDAGVCHITVVLGHRGNEIQEVLTSRISRSDALTFVYNASFATTQMLDSIQLGLLHLPPCDWFFVTPGDMPAISVSTYKNLIKHAADSNQKVLFPLLEGYRKHPPLISNSCKSDILEFQGSGLRALWSSYENEILEVATEDIGCRIDVDVREDYQNVCNYLLHPTVG